MIVEQLNIYPVKGLGGIQVKSAKALEQGFENDRRFMLVDQNGKFLSQRNTQEMALFTPQMIGSKLLIQYKQESIQLDLEQEEGDPMNTTVWGNDANAIKVGKEADEWFSDQLGLDCILVKMNKDSRRNKSLLKAPGNTQVSFADGYPYLVLGTESLDFLNSKLDEKLRMDRFRANIIVQTNTAHEEDEIDQCKINGIKFRMMKPCARCQVITIDQQNGVISKAPLKTLSTYRKIDNKVYFGVNAVCFEEGIVEVGSKLTTSP